MKKTRHAEEQIAHALRQAELGTPVAEGVRKMGVSERTFCRWKKQYAGMGEVANAVLEGDANLRSIKLAASGFTFLYPDLESALRHELSI